MAQTFDEIMNPASVPPRDPAFPHAPIGWTREAAEDQARESGMRLTEEHWNAVRALQEYYSRNDNTVNLRELHDALDERFHAQGGMKRLYQLFPDGPVAAGCRVAGLEAPGGAVDKGFGSVV